jgi:hypothetical protein
MAKGRVAQLVGQSYLRSSDAGQAISRVLRIRELFEIGVHKAMAIALFNLCAGGGKGAVARLKELKGEKYTA